MIYTNYVPTECLYEGNVMSTNVFLDKIIIPCHDRSGLKNNNTKIDFYL